MYGRAENIVGLGGCIRSQCLDHAPPQSREGPTAIVSPPPIVRDHCCLRGPKLRPDPVIPESHPHRAGSQRNMWMSGREEDLSCVVGLEYEPLTLGNEPILHQRGGETFRILKLHQKVASIKLSAS